MTRLIPLLVVLTFAASASAQTPAPPVPTPPDAGSAPPPAPPPNYIYTVDGRRDPFVALVGRTDQRTGGAAPVRGEGLAGLLTDEVIVRGILLSQGRWVAMIGGPAGRVFTVRAGDRVADGTIRDITQQYIVIQQEVDDPLAPQKQRDVRKFLRGGENK